MANTTTQFREGNPELRLRAGDLLARYPHIEDDELLELLHFFNSAPAIDTALLACDPMALSKITRFEAEQKGRLRHEARLSPLLFVVFLGIALIAYAIWMGV